MIIRWLEASCFNRRADYRAENSGWIPHEGRQEVRRDRLNQNQNNPTATRKAQKHNNNNNQMVQESVKRRRADRIRTAMGNIRIKSMIIQIDGETKQKKGDHPQCVG